MKRYFVTKFYHFLLFIKTFFGGSAFKIEFVVFVYELINYLFMKLFSLLLGYVTPNLANTWVYLYSDMLIVPYCYSSSKYHYAASIKNI